MEKTEVKVVNEKIDKSKSIAKIGNFPLTAVRTEAGYVITFGKNMICKKKFKTIEDINNYLRKPENAYTIIPIMAYVYFNEINNIKK